MAGVPVKDRPQVSSMLYPNSVEARWRIGSLISARTITDGGQFSFLLRKGTTVETPSNNEITPYPPVRNPSVWISWPPYLRLCAVSSNANKPVFCETSRLYVEGLFKKTLVKWTLFVVCCHATLATFSFQVNRHWIRKGWAPSRQLFVWGKGWRAVSAGESFWCDAWIVIRWVYSVEVHNGKVQVAVFQRQSLCLKTCDVFLIGSDFFMVFIAAPFPYLRGPRNRGGFHAKPDSMLQYHVLILGMASFNAIQLFFLQINLGDLGGVHMTRNLFVTCFGFTTFAVMCFWWKRHWCWWSTVDAWWIFMGTWSMVTAFHRFFFSQDCYNNGGLLLLCDQERGRNCMFLGKTRRDTSWHCRVFWKFELGKCCLKSHRSKPSVIENVPSSHLYTNILYLFCFEVVQIKHKSLFFQWTKSDEI